jgi:hypothetical protein
MWYVINSAMEFHVSSATDDVTIPLRVSELKDIGYDGKTQE